MKWEIPVSKGDLITVIDGSGSVESMQIGESVRIDVNHINQASFGVASVPSFVVPEGYFVRLLVDVTTVTSFAAEIVNESATYVEGGDVDYTWERQGMF